MALICAGQCLEKFKALSVCSYNTLAWMWKVKCGRTSHSIACGDVLAAVGFRIWLQGDDDEISECLE